MMRSSRHPWVITVIILCLLWLPLRSQQRVVLDTVQAPQAGGSHPLTIILPDGYTPQREYPVLYLLHGYDGSNRDWTERTTIEEFLAEWPLIVVMPDAKNSWYVDSPVDASSQYETYLISTVLSFVETRYQVDPARRAIAGLSMGGYGALMLAMRHPELFRFGGSLSGAIVVPASLRRPEDVPPRPAIRATQVEVFGDPTENVLDRYDLGRLAKTLAPKNAPYLYLVTGIQDGLVEFLPAQRSLTDRLRTLGLPYEYHETPGGHSWSYWDKEIRPLLRRMREVMEF